VHFRDHGALIAQPPLDDADEVLELDRTLLCEPPPMRTTPGARVVETTRFFVGGWASRRVWNRLCGRSVGLWADGNTAMLGGPTDSSGAGAVWVFGR
jgi:hypothetical protein